MTGRLNIELSQGWRARRKSHSLMKDTIYSHLKNSQRESKVGYALFLSTAIEMNDVLADVLTISLLKPINPCVTFPIHVSTICSTVLQT